MISGRFGENGELFFEIELIASDGECFPVEVLLVNRRRFVLGFAIALPNLLITLRLITIPKFT